MKSGHWTKKQWDEYARQHYEMTLKLKVGRDGWEVINQDWIGHRYKDAYYVQHIRKGIYGVIWFDRGAGAGEWRCKDYFTTPRSIQMFARRKLKDTVPVEEIRELRREVRKTMKQVEALRKARGG